MKRMQTLSLFNFKKRPLQTQLDKPRRAAIEPLEDRQLLALDALSIGGVALTDAQLTGGLAGTGYVYTPSANRSDDGSADLLTLKNFESVYSIKAKGNLTIVVNGNCLIVVDGSQNAIEVDGNLTLEALNNAVATTGDNPTDAVSTDVLSLIGGLRVGGTFTVEGTDSTTGAPTATSPRVSFGDCNVSYYASTFSQLQSAWSAANTAKSGLIVVTNDIADFNSGLTVDSGVSITLATTGDHTISRASNFRNALFVVNKSGHGYDPSARDASKIDRTAQLTLGLELGMGTNELTLSGSAVWSDPTCAGAGKASGPGADSALVYTAGTLNMFDGIALKNNYSTVNGAAVFVDGYNGSYKVDESTGVETPTVMIDKEATGVFNMYGGTIADNYSTTSGGGVATYGEFNFYGGTIKNCFGKKEGGGVYVRGGMTMDGGAVLDCGSGAYKLDMSAAVTDHGKGGGVHNSNNGYVHMTGASLISGCYAYTGGGMYVGGNGTAKTYLTGGTISENTAFNGGGVATNSTLILGGEIEITLNEARLVDNKNAYRIFESSETAVAKVDATRGLGDGVYVFAITNANGEVTTAATGAAQILIGGAALVDPNNDVYFAVLSLKTTNNIKINGVGWHGEPLVPVYVYSKLTCDGTAMLINTQQNKGIYDPEKDGVAGKLQLSSMPIVRFANDVLVEATKFAVVSSYWEISQVVEDCSATENGATYTESSRANYVEYLDYMKGFNNDGTTKRKDAYYLGKGAASSPSQYLAFYSIGESNTAQVRINDMIFESFDHALDFLARHYNNDEEGSLNQLGLLNDPTATTDVGGAVTIYLMHDTTVAYSHKSSVDITINIVAETEASLARARLGYGDYDPALLVKKTDDEVVKIMRGLYAKEHLLQLKDGNGDPKYTEETLAAEIQERSEDQTTNEYVQYVLLMQREINVAFLASLYDRDPETGATDLSKPLFTAADIDAMTDADILEYAQSVRAFDYLITVYDSNVVVTDNDDENGDPIVYKEILGTFKYNPADLYAIWKREVQGNGQDGPDALIKMALSEASDIDLSGFTGSNWTSSPFYDYRRSDFSVTVTNAASPTTVTLNGVDYAYYAFGSASAFTTYSKGESVLLADNTSCGGVYVLNGRVVKSITVSTDDGSVTYSSELYQTVNGDLKTISIENGFFSFDAGTGTVTINDVAFDGYTPIYWSLGEAVTVSLSDVFQPYVSVYSNRENDDASEWHDGVDMSVDFGSGAREAAFIFGGSADGDAATSTKINLGGNGGVIVVDGYYRYSGSQMLFYITNDASMTVQGNTTIRNARSAGTLEQYDAEKLSFGGAGAFVVYDGSLTINVGTKIDNCGGFHAGAIYVGKDGTFTMNGGEITNCVGAATNEVGDAPDSLDDYTGAGAIYNDGTTTINAGTISDNVSLYGAIANAAVGKLTIVGVKLKNNTNGFDATKSYVGNGLNVARGNIAIMHAGESLTFADGTDGTECSLDIDGLVYLALGAYTETYGGWHSFSHQITVTSEFGDLLAEGAGPIMLDSYDATGGARVVLVDVSGDRAADVERTKELANTFEHLASAVVQESQLNKDVNDLDYLTVTRNNYLMLGINKIYYVNETNGDVQVDCEYVAQKNLIFDLSDFFGPDFDYANNYNVDNGNAFNRQETFDVDGDGDGDLVQVNVTYAYEAETTNDALRGTLFRSWSYQDADGDSVDVVEDYIYYVDSNLVALYTSTTRNCATDHYVSESGQELGSEMFPNKKEAGFTKFEAGSDATGTYVNVWIYGTSDSNAPYVAPESRSSDYKGPERFYVSLDQPAIVNDGVEYVVSFDGDGVPIKITSYKNDAAYSIENKNFGAFSTQIDSVTNAYGYTCKVSPVAWGAPLNATIDEGGTVTKLSSPKSETETYSFKLDGLDGVGSKIWNDDELKYVYTAAVNDAGTIDYDEDADKDAADKAKTYYKLENDYVTKRKFFIAVDEWATDAKGNKTHALKATAYLFYYDAAGKVDYMEKYVATYLDSTDDGADNGGYVTTAFRTKDSNGTVFGYWITFDDGAVSPVDYSSINYCYVNEYGETFTQTAVAGTESALARITKFKKQYGNSTYAVDYSYNDSGNITNVAIAEDHHMQSYYVYGYSGTKLYGLKSSTEGSQSALAFNFEDREANVADPNFGTGEFALPENTFFRSWNTERDKSGESVFPNVGTVDLSKSTVVLYADVVSNNVVNTTYDEFTLEFNASTGKYVDTNEWTSLREAIFLSDFNEMQKDVAGYDYVAANSRIVIQTDPSKWQNANAANFNGYGINDAELGKYVWTTRVETTYYFPETMNFILTGGRLGVKTGDVYNWTDVYQTSGSITIHSAVSLDFTEVIGSASNYAAYVLVDDDLDTTTGATSVSVTMEEHDSSTPSRIFSVIANENAASKTIKKVVYNAETQTYSLGDDYATSEPTTASKPVRFVGLDFYDGGAYSTTNKINGGAIMTLAETHTYVADCEFVDNKGYLGGAIANQGTMTLTNVNVRSTNSNTWKATDNDVSSVCDEKKINAYSGGGVYNTGSLTMTNVSMNGLSVKGVGGGLANSATTKEGVTTSMGTVFGSKVNVVACIAYSYQKDGKSVDGYGGGFANLGVATFTNSYFINNYASENGAGITNVYKNVNGATSSLSLTNCFVTNNVAGYFGGGLLNGSTATISGSQFSNNAAYCGNGGAIYNTWYGEDDAPLKFQRTDIDNQNDTSTDTIAVGALTVKANGSTVSVFSSNQASGYGGAIADSGKSLQVSGTLFSSANPNVARYGKVIATTHGTLTSADGVQKTTLAEGVFDKTVVYPGNTIVNANYECLDQVFASATMALGETFYDPSYIGTTGSSAAAFAGFQTENIKEMLVSTDGAAWVTWELEQTLAQSGVDLNVGENRLWVVVVDVNGIYSETISMNVTVLDSDPIVSVNVASDVVSSALCFSADVETGSPIQTWTVNWGDGTSTTLDNYSYSVRFGHVYEKTGDYEVTMELRKSNGFGEGIVYSLLTWTVDETQTVANESSAAVAVETPAEAPANFETNFEIANAFSETVASEASATPDVEFEIADFDCAFDSFALSSRVDLAQAKRSRFNSTALDAFFQNDVSDENAPQTTSNGQSEILDETNVAEIAVAFVATKSNDETFIKTLNKTEKKNASFDDATTDVDRFFFDDADWIERI